MSGVNGPVCNGGAEMRRVAEVSGFVCGACVVGSWMGGRLYTAGTAGVNVTGQRVERKS